MKSLATALQSLSLVVWMVGNLSVVPVIVDAFVSTTTTPSTTTSTSRIRPEITIAIRPSTTSSSSSSAIFNSNNSDDNSDNNVTTEQNRQRPTPFFMETKTHSSEKKESESDTAAASSSLTSTTATISNNNDEQETTTTTQTDAQFGDVMPLRSSSSKTATNTTTTLTTSATSSSSIATSVTATAGSATTTTAQFGEVMPLRKKAASTATTTTATKGEEAQFGDVMPLRSSPLNPIGGAQFGEVMSLKKPKPAAVAVTPASSSSSKPVVSDVERLKNRKIRNIIVAALSIVIAISDYGYKYTHPATPIQLLVQMEKNSASVETIGRNSKPTVIDFWAPWCENCRFMAPTLFQLEENYKDKVNFIMVNGDDPDNWALIEKLGVDAIPHLALLEADGTVDTALIGTVPKLWLSKDLDTLLENANNINVDTASLASTDITSDSSSSTDRQDHIHKRTPLPYQMLDVFANKPAEQRKISFETTSTK